jgi:hypothetical protein
LLLAIMPARRSSYSVARRSARANALNVASTMWWLFLPASCRMCSVVPDVLTNDCEWMCDDHQPSGNTMAGTHFGP